MTVQILFVQGGGEAVHDQWDNKLVDSLGRALGSGYRIHYPRMPHENDPSYAAWKPALAQALRTLPDGAVLVGHSLGGTVLMHVLAKERLTFKPAALMLIAAPFIGEGGWQIDEMPARTDFAARLPRGLPVYLYHGAEDQIVPAAHAQLYAAVIPGSKVRLIPHGDHQLNNDLSPVARDIERSCSNA